ncbi:hypothetical protein BCR33DRAFT_718944, partial [Rhizoclosmatium globosum]
QMIMKEQDQQLEGVAVTISNMKEIAQVMNQEIDDQTAYVDLFSFVVIERREWFTKVCCY